MARRDLARSVLEGGRYRDRYNYALAWRWLRSQCGRRWDDVFSDISSMFDVRTRAGKRIVTHYLLREVRGASVVDEHQLYELEIDADGILRRVPEWRPNRRAAKPPLWTGGNRALQIGARWWWVGDRVLEPCVHAGKCRYLHRCVDGVDRHYTPDTRLRPLTPTEVGRLTSLPPHVRGVVVWRGRGVVHEPDEAPLAVSSDDGRTSR